MGADTSRELADKLALVRSQLQAHDLGGIRFRGVDWFSWITCGGSSVVILTAEAGVAEVLVTSDDAWVLTDGIEAARLEQEEVPAGLAVWEGPWHAAAAREGFVRLHVRPERVASDRPTGNERPLPDSLRFARWSLHPAELERYRTLGRDASEAATDALERSRPEWTGQRLAGAAAAALWERGIHPALTLVGGERRLPLHRHPTARAEPLGRRWMLVICGRRQGLYANLTRFVYAAAPSSEERALQEATLAVEAAAFDASRPGATLGGVYEAIAAAYVAAGHAGGEEDHHQGGPCGYLSRDVLALPGSALRLAERNALAWNPSLPGAKVEDTVVTAAGQIEVLTVDPRWPTLSRFGRQRPDLLVLEV